FTGADRDQAEGTSHQTPRGHHTATGDRSDGGTQTQSRPGNACDRRHDDHGKASQAHSRSTAAVIASTGSRRPKEEDGPRDASGRRCHETAKEGVTGGHKHYASLTRWLRRAPAGFSGAQSTASLRLAL